jgi:alpha-beta hydrolase superfamily lysophospholipase
MTGNTGGSLLDAARTFTVRGAILTALILSASSADAAGRVIVFRAPDGRMISGLLMEADQRPAPAVVLVPMLGRSKDDWQPVAQKLADANITALAIDLPGPTVPGDPKALARWSDDIRAAVGYLASRPGEIRSGSIGVAGASLGASLAALEAAGDGSVRSIALISPSLEYRGLRIEAAMRAYGARPALLVASVRDPYAARSTRELAQDAPGRRDVRWSDVPAHGTMLLSRDADLVRAIVEWFQGTLG